MQTGGLVDLTKISIGVHGPEVASSAISVLLGVEPTSQHRAGEPRKVGPPWPSGAWLFTVEGTPPRGPEEVAEELLAAVPPPDAPVWSKLRSKHRLHLKLAVFPLGWNRGFPLSTDVLQRLASIAGEVDFDIYNS